MQENKNISEYRQTLKEKILDAAMAAFSAHGIKAVKMDDIANSLSISKRTLYELYSNKEDLLFEGVKKYHTLKREEMRRFALQSHNVMDIVLHAFSMKVKDIKMTVPKFYSDVAKYPKLLSYFDQEKEKDRQQLIQFMQRGTAEGYFCQNLNYELIARIIEMQNKLVMDNKLYNQYSMETVFYNLMFLSLRGLCTPKGIEVLDRFLHAYHNDRNGGQQEPPAHTATH